MFFFLYIVHILQFEGGVLSFAAESALQRRVSLATCKGTGVRAHARTLPHMRNK
jgi:hypothetical protein